MHVPVKVLVATLLVTVTVPDGVIAVPDDVSVTVTVHVVGWLIATVEGEHATLVVVVRTVTVIVAVPLLPEWAASPAYVAVSKWLPVPITVGV